MLTLIYAILTVIFVFREDEPYDDPDPDTQYVSQVEGVTDNEDGTFTYDDGEISLTFEQIPSKKMENEIKKDIEEAASVLKGESCGNEWTVVSDEKGVPKTVYVKSGDTSVSVAVNNCPKDSGKEYAASIAASLVTDKKTYSENKQENNYRTDSSSFYIEEANCLLYYPAQLSAFSKKGDSYIFSDTKSSTSLKVTLSPNEYTSMAEVEGFIKNTENNLVLAYGPNWFTSESIKSGKVTFGYSGFGSKYIVEAELTYKKDDREIFDDLRGLIKCCFVGDGIWKSTASAEGYSKDRSTVYSDKFSREIAAYYSKEYGVILLYPEIFSEVEKQDGGVFFTDPVTEATISFWADSEYLSLADWPERYGLNDSYIDGERRVKASHLDGGTYAVMYLTDNNNICAFLEYPMEYAWVYEEFEQEFTIVASGSEIRNIEMQTVFIEAYGALITMPLQFSETSFYDGVIRYEDALNGMELTVSFDYLTSEKERKNLFACFDVVADDDNVFVGDSYVRWLSNQGFFYGARGNDMKALMQIDSPNAERAYESTLSMFCVEFVTEESKEETKAQTLAKEATGMEAVSDPPEAEQEDQEPVKDKEPAKDKEPEKEKPDDMKPAKDIKEFEGLWCNSDKSMHLDIEENGEWEISEWMDGGNGYLAKDWGKLKYSAGESNTYYAESDCTDNKKYKMVEFDEGVILLDKYIFFKYDALRVADEEYSWDPNRMQKEILEFKGNWYDASAETYIVFDGKGRWTFYECAPGTSKAAETDNGIFFYSYSNNEYCTYYAKSAIKDVARFKVLEIDTGIIQWNGVTYYRNRPANMGNEYYGWNAELYQRYLSEFEATWDYYTDLEGGRDDDDYWSDTYIEIDGDANWRLIRRTSGTSEVTELDHGILYYSEDEFSTFYAYSYVNKGKRYKIFEFDDKFIFWDDRPYCVRGSY